MGAWGTGIFDNDTACDWAYKLEKVNNLSVIESALDEVLNVGEEYLDSHEAQEALAAAEVIARLKGTPGIGCGYTETVDKWVEKNRLTPRRPSLKKRSKQ